MTKFTDADRATVLNDLYTGQFNDPMRVVAFNTRAGPAMCPTIAPEIQRRADIQHHQLTGALTEFVDFYTRPARQRSLRLV